MLPGRAWTALLGALLLGWWIAAVRRQLCTQDTTVLAESFDEAIPARRGRNSRAGPTLTLLLHLAGQGAEPFPGARICTFTE